MNVQYQNQFFNSEEVALEAFDLMEREYGFYFGLHADYLQGLRNGAGREDFRLCDFLNRLMKRLLDGEICGALGKTKERFLEVRFKLKAFYHTDRAGYFLIGELFSIFEKISDQLQLHIEFGKYPEVALNERSFSEFLDRTREVQVGWNKFSDSFRLAAEIFSVDAKSALPEHHLPVRLSCESQAPLNFGNGDFQSLVKFVDDLLEFIQKIQGETEVSETFRIRNANLVEAPVLNMSVDERLFGLFRTFFHSVRESPAADENALKQALQSCVDEVGDGSRKETVNLVNRSTGKFKKCLKSLPEFSFGFFEPAPSPPRAKTSEILAGQSPAEPAEVEIEIDSLPAPFLEETPAKPDPTEIRERKSHIGFLTG